LIFSANSIPLNEINEEKQPYIVILKPKNTLSTPDNNDYSDEIIHKFDIGDNFRGYVGLFESNYVDEILSKRDDVELIYIMMVLIRMVSVI
jgi:hypothetical protein